jgi:hypothetical protein
MLFRSFAGYIKVMSHKVVDWHAGAAAAVADSKAIARDILNGVVTPGRLFRDRCPVH